ncbi:MAG: amino acid adenylation domain-containing protein, partial [Cyclobacteriaceae bacterium]
TSLDIIISYDSHAYDSQSVERMVSHLDTLIDIFASQTDRSLHTIEFLTAEERNELLETFNSSSANYPTNKTVIDLFEEQVSKTPDEIALIYNNKKLTFREVNEQANQLAHYLKDNYSIEPDSLIAFQLERSERMIITLFAILKARAAYIPIDIDFPAEKVQYVAKDSGCLLIIDEDKLKAMSAESSQYRNSNLSEKPDPDNLIYVIYTSGSTGLPKGVLIEHRHIVAHIHNVRELYGVSTASRFLQFFNVAFDAAAQEIFTTLCFGASLCLKTANVDPDYIYDLISTHKITHADFSTAFFNSFISTLNHKTFTHQLEFCAIGGEKLEKTVLEKQWDNIATFTRQFYNVYGPTETTLTATWYPIMHEGKLSEFGEAIPIGQSYAGRQVLILNSDQQLQPIGITGEICIGGISLARGYLNREKLTKEKFIDNPYSKDERLYRTGDLGRWLLDGNIEFLGRKDDQVKVRGYRIELGEIEHTLSKHSQIKQSVVLARESTDKSKELIAYVTSERSLDASELIAFLKDRLPEYMIPAFFVQLEELPLTSNGKIDKKALPDPEGLGLSSGVEYVAPTTDQQKILAQIWIDVLKREGVGLKDSFYNLGGDSIKSIQVVARLKQQGYLLKVEHLLRTPVLEDLARLMEPVKNLVDQSEVVGPVLLTPIQQWFFETPEISVHSYFNQSVLLESTVPLDKAVLEKSIAGLVRHHDALRMVYHQGENGWEQLNRGTESDGYTLDFYDLRSEENPFRRVSELGGSLQSGIDLSAGPLFRVGHFRLDDGDRLGLIIHHLVV